MSLLGQSTTPIEERVSLSLFEFEHGRVSCPRGSTRNLKTFSVVLLLLTHRSLLSGREKIGIMSGCTKGRIGNDFDVLTLYKKGSKLSESENQKRCSEKMLTSGEIGTGESCSGKKFIQISLLSN